MADQKIPHKHTLRLRKFTHQKLQYMLMDDLGDSNTYTDVNNDDEIKIEAAHNYITIRYEYKNKHSDGFSIIELTGSIRLIGYNFRMERVKGTLWCINVFKIEKGSKEESEELSEHDTDIEPPVNNLP